MQQVLCDSFTYWSQYITETPSLIFFDPPFGIGQKYAEYDDSRTPNSMIWSVGEIMREHLFKNSTFVLYGPEHFLGNYYQQCRDRLGVLEPQLIVWKYNFCQNRAKQYNQTFSVLLVSRGVHSYFEPDRVDSLRVSKYNDSRCDPESPKYEGGGTKPVGTIWPDDAEDPAGWGRVQGNAKERWDIAHGALVDHPNQIPMKLNERLVRQYTPEDGFVVDLCAGTGGLGLACKRLGRRYLGFEIGEKTCESANKRIAEG